jgi:type 1 fimbria pilin
MESWIMKKLIKTLALICSAIVLNMVLSIANACTPMTNNGWGPTDPVNFDPNVPDGTVIAVYANLWAGRGPSDCAGLLGTAVWKGIGPRNETYQTYATGVPGVGIRIRFESGYGCQPGVWWPVTCSGLLGGTQSGMDYYRVEFVKVGPVTAGGTVSKIFATMDVSGDPSPPPTTWIYYTWGLPPVLNPSVPTCKVTTPSITVPMGSVAANSFASVGSVSASQPFNIALYCSGGTIGAYTNVYMTLTDVTNPANVTDTLSLNKSSTATGLGIQVLSGAQTIKFGPDSSAGGSLGDRPGPGSGIGVEPNQWFAGGALNGTFNIPLAARYVRTGTVTPGTANASATFTMSYQ